MALLFRHARRGFPWLLSFLPQHLRQIGEVRRQAPCLVLGGPVVLAELVGGEEQLRLETKVATIAIWLLGLSCLCTQRRIVGRCLRPSTRHDGNDPLGSEVNATGTAIFVKKAVGTMLQPQRNGNPDNRTGHEPDGAPASRESSRIGICNV
jgi:hypothetical protein